MKIVIEPFYIIRDGNINPLDIISSIPNILQYFHSKSCTTNANEGAYDKRYGIVFGDSLLSLSIVYPFSVFFSGRQSVIKIKKNMRIDSSMNLPLMQIDIRTKHKMYK